MSPPSLPPPRLTLLTLISATATLYFLYKSRHRLTRLRQTLTNHPNKRTRNKRGKLFYLSQTNTSKTLARRLHALLTLNDLPFDLVDPKDYEPEDLLKESCVIIVASTWENGGPPENGSFLVNWLSESADDFRVGGLVMREYGYAVFGVGSGSYGETYNAVARDVARGLRRLGAREVVGLGEGDVDCGDLDEVFGRWCEGVVRVLNGGLAVGNGDLKSKSEGEAEVSEEDEDNDDDEEEEVGQGGDESGIVDLEDIAGKGPMRKSKADGKFNGEVNGRVVNGVKEMVTPVLRANLEKQVWFPGSDWFY